MEYIGSQIKIMIHKKSFQICFVMVVFFALFVSVMAAIEQKGFDASNIFHPAIMTALNADGNYSWYFAKYYPFLVILPACFVLFDDKKTGMEVMLKSRMGCGKYYVSKGIAGFVVSFLTFTVPFFIELLLNTIIFPAEATKILTNWPTYGSTYIMQAQSYINSEIFFRSVYLHSVVHICMLGILSGCACIFTLGVSSFGIKFKVFLFLPVYLLFYLLGTFSTDEVITYIDLYILYCDASLGKHLCVYIGLMIFMLVTGSVCIKANMKRNELE